MTCPWQARSLWWTAKGERERRAWSPHADMLLFILAREQGWGRLQFPACQKALTNNPHPVSRFLCYLIIKTDPCQNTSLDKQTIGPLSYGFSSPKHLCVTLPLILQTCNAGRSYLHLTSCTGKKHISNIWIKPSIHKGLHTFPLTYFSHSKVPITKV